MTDQHTQPQSAAARPTIIIATSGTGGDVQPFITLGLGFLARGHRVLMLAPRIHETMIQASGIAYQTFGSHDEWQVLLNNPDLWDERKGWGVIWAGLTPHLDALRHLVQQRPADETCVVLCHPILVPMAALARSVRPDLRIVAAYLAPSNFCSSHDMLTLGSLPIPSWVPISWRRGLWKIVHTLSIDPITMPSLNAARNRHGLPPMAHFFAHMLTAPDASLGLFPGWFAAHQPDWPQPFLQGDFVRSPSAQPVSLSPELQQFLSQSDRPIVFTPGTGHRHAARYFDIARNVLARLGRRGVFVTPHAAQLPDPLPSNILWQPSAPFSALLPQAAAIVHHGGIGTMAQAFQAAIPQLIVPFAYDQFDNGLRAKRLGGADVLLAKHLSVGRMEKMLAGLLCSDRVGQACKAIAQTMADTDESSRLLDHAEAALFPPAL